MWTSLPLLVALVMFLVIPESPRWLLKKGKLDEFRKVIRKAERQNKVWRMKKSYGN